MMKTSGDQGAVIAVLQARMSSTRLPGKVLLRVCSKPMLQHQIERVRRSRLISTLVIATSTDLSDDAVATLCEDLQVPVYRGSLDDVLDRMVRAAQPYRPQWLVRLTGDCPLADPAVIDEVIAAARDHDVDYASNTLEPTFPDGLDVECIRFAALEQAWREATKPSEREHVTPFVHTRPGRYKLHGVRHSSDCSALRWTVDEAADFVFVSQVFEHLYPANPEFSMQDVFDLLARFPALSALNARHTRNEGYLLSLARDAKASAS